MIAAGWLIVGGLVLQIGLLIKGGLSRLLFEQRRSQLEQERLALEIKAARLKIQTVETDKTAWNGIRKFNVAQKVKEAKDTFSFYLKPHDGKPLPHFKPGQYLTFSLTVPGQAKPVARCYSLSDISRTNHYRVTIKRCLPPPQSSHPAGLGSSFFCDVIKEGDIVDTKAPNGHFFLAMEKPRPVVLISGGIGVTPMVTMANALTESGDPREIWFFFGARNSTDHMFKDYMAEITVKNKNIHMHVCYSQPLPTDVPGRDFHHEGRVSVELFKQLLPSNNYDYFLCGPGPFMESITTDLTAWGVQDAWAHFEAFGPASVRKNRPPRSTVRRAAPSPRRRSPLRAVGGKRRGMVPTTRCWRWPKSKASKLMPAAGPAAADPASWRSSRAKLNTQAHLPMSRSAPASAASASPRAHS